MGDVLTLVRKTQEEFDIADAEKMQEKMLTAKFDFTDFLKQTKLLKNMGSLGGIMKMIPGMNKLSDEQMRQGEVQLKRTEAMINSMTVEERRNPKLLASSPRRRRIGKGAGYAENDVTKLVSDFQKMRTMMQQMSQGNFAGMPGMPGNAGNGRAPESAWFPRLYASRRRKRKKISLKKVSDSCSRRKKQEGRKL